jgi:hypothetical protein
VILQYQGLCSSWGGVASFVPSSGRLVGGGGLVGVLFENWTVDASILLIVLGSLR